MAKAREGQDKPKLPLEAMRKQCPDDNSARDRWPTLMGCLLPIWSEGKCKRQAGRLSIRLVGGYYILSLHCPTEGLETSLTTDTLVGLFDALEARLNDPAAVWTPDFESQKKTRQVRIDAVQ